MRQALAQIQAKHGGAEAAGNATLTGDEYEEILNALLGAHGVRLPEGMRPEDHAQVGALLQQVLGPALELLLVETPIVQVPATRRFLHFITLSGQRPPLLGAVWTGVPQHSSVC